jgi:hypothetical protein
VGTQELSRYCDGGEKPMRIWPMNMLKPDVAQVMVAGSLMIGGSA